MILVSSCHCLCSIHWNQVLSREWRCSWSSADRRCSNYIWMIYGFIAYWTAAYIRGFTQCISVLFSSNPCLNSRSVKLHTFLFTCIPWYRLYIFNETLNPPFAVENYTIKLRRRKKIRQQITIQKWRKYLRSGGSSGNDLCGPPVNKQQERHALYHSGGQLKQCWCRTLQLRGGPGHISIPPLFIGGGTSSVGWKPSSQH